MFTIKDLAKESNYTVATVSRALNGNPLVADKTRKKILEIAAKNGYEPNAMARSLVMKKSSTIAIIVPDIVNPYFPMIVKAVQEEARRWDYFTIVCNSNWDANEEENIIKLMYGQRVGGIIMDPTNDQTYQRALASKVNLPVVFVGNRTEDISISSVLVDNERAMREGIEYLVSLGHKKIALIGGLENTHTNRARRQGYCSVLQNTFGGVDPSLIIPTEYQGHAGYVAVEKLIKENRLPTAIATANDLIAFGVLDCLRDYHIKVPEDISVLGFDDVESAEYIGLTTIREPRKEMGVTATQILMETIQVKEGAHSEGLQQVKHVLLKPELIKRYTCAPCKT